MSDTTPYEKAPRHFWRRLIAFCIDFTLFLAIFYFLLALPLGYLTNKQPVIPSIFQTGTCTNIPMPEQYQPHLDAITHPALTDKSRVTTIAQLCQTRRMLVFNFHTLRLIKTLRPSGSNSKNTATFYVAIPVDENLNYVRQIDTQPYFAWLFLLYFIISMTLFGTTFGKKCVALTVITKSEMKPTFKAIFSRELLRWSPALIISTLTIAFSFWQKNPDLNNPDEIRLMFEKIGFLLNQSWFWIWIPQTIAALIILAFLFTWVKWNGQILYDRVSSLQVRSTE